MLCSFFHRKKHLRDRHNVIILLKNAIGVNAIRKGITTKQKSHNFP